MLITLKIGKNFKRKGMIQTFMVNKLGGEFKFKLKIPNVISPSVLDIEYYVGLSTNNHVFEYDNINDFINPDKHQLVFYWKFTIIMVVLIFNIINLYLIKNNW